MLGEVLRKERERRNLTVQDIEQGTSIRSLYIEHIENGNYDKLPGDVYTKGFIRSYAKFLNLNADELVKQFAIERNPVAAVNIAEDGSDNIGETELNVESPEIPSRRERNKNRDRKSSVSSSSNLSNVSDSGSSFKLVAAVVLIAALAAGAWVYLSGSVAEVVDIDVKQEQEKTDIDQPKVAQSETANTNLDAANKNENTASAAAQNNQQGIHLQAKFSGECWTQVVADGMLVYEDIAGPGQVLSWQGNENVTIRLGNAGVVEVANNGQNIGYLGGFGEVTERTFTKR